jgi:hypothetical protein
MNHHLQKPHRRNICLKGYDYSQPGANFVTMVTPGRASLFGEVVDVENSVDLQPEPEEPWRT